MGKHLDKQINLHKKGKRLFLETSEFYGSADIGLGDPFQIYQYINGYKLSADALVNAGINIHQDNLNHYIYSIILNYKQFLELSMKIIYLFYSSDTAEIKTQNITRVGYHLEKTWELIEPQLNLIYTTSEKITVMHTAKRYIKEFQHFDDQSYNFLFPFTEALITPSSSEKRIDVINLKGRVEELSLFFKFSELELEKYLESEAWENIEWRTI